MCFYSQQVVPGQSYIDALPPDAAGRVRTMLWVPLGPDHAADGRLTIQTQGNAPDRVYLVMEVVCDRTFEGRGFAVRRAGQPEPYFPFVGANGQDWSCSCPHGCYRGHEGPCVHAFACRQLIANGWLPSEFLTDAPAESHPSAEQVAADAPHDAPF